MSDALTWQKDGPALQGGQVGGDSQWGESWSIQFTPTEQPDDGLFALIDVYYYADSFDVMNERPDPEFGVTGQILFTVCKDPDNPGGTEVWADIIYDNDFPFGYADYKEAESKARDLANSFNSEYICWDGRSPVVG